jgi:hypothetical protein
MVAVGGGTIERVAGENCERALSRASCMDGANLDYSSQWPEMYGLGGLEQ